MGAMNGMIVDKILRTRKLTIRIKTTVKEEEEMDITMGKLMKNSNVPKITSQPLEIEADPIAGAQEMKTNYMLSIIAKRKKPEKRKQCRAPRF